MENKLLHDMQANLELNYNFTNPKDIITRGQIKQ